MPTSGGLYYWSSALSSPKWGPFNSWCTAYMNVTGQVALVCSIAYTVADMISVAVGPRSSFMDPLNADIVSYVDYRCYGF